MRRAATVLLTAALTSGGLAALAPSASAAQIVPRNLTITVTGLGPALAGGDMAYRGSTTSQPVTLVTGPGRSQQLTVPVTG